MVVVHEEERARDGSIQTMVTFAQQRVARLSRVCHTSRVSLLDKEEIGESRSRLAFAVHAVHRTPDEERVRADRHPPRPPPHLL